MKWRPVITIGIYAAMRGPHIAMCVGRPCPVSRLMGSHVKVGGRVGGHIAPGGRIVPPLPDTGQSLFHV